MSVVSFTFLLHFVTTFVAPALSHLSPTSFSKTFQCHCVFISLPLNKAALLNLFQIPIHFY